MSDTWQALALCRGAADPEMFFPGETDDAGIERAKAVCRICPVLRPCLLQGLQLEAHGIWGSTTPTERDELRAAYKLPGAATQYAQERGI